MAKAASGKSGAKGPVAAKGRGASGGVLFTPDMRIVALHGDDGFLISQRAAEFAGVLREAHGEIEQFTFDGDSASVATVLDELRSYGLMQQFKLVSVEKADAFLKREGHREVLERYAANPVEHAALLLRSEGWNRGKLDALIEKAGLIVVCDSPKDAEAAAWVVRRGEEEYDVRVEASAASMLVSRLGTDLGRLDMELGKLSCMVDAGKPVTDAVVRSSVGLSREEKAWTIQAVLLRGDPGEALRALEELLVVSREPKELVMWAVTDLVRKLHGASAMQAEGADPGTIMKVLKLWGPEGSLVLSLGRRIPVSRWADLLKTAIETDYRSKTGQGDGERLLEVATVTVADTIGRSGR